MAKIVEGSPEKWLADDGKQKIPLREYCRNARLQAGMSMDKLNRKSGLGHPLVNLYEQGKSQSLPSMITALLTLGYEIEIKAPRERDG